MFLTLKNSDGIVRIDAGSISAIKESVDEHGNKVFRVHYDRTESLRVNTPSGIKAVEAYIESQHIPQWDYRTYEEGETDTPTGFYNVYIYGKLVTGVETSQLDSLPMIIRQHVSDVPEHCREAFRETFATANSTKIVMDVAKLTKPTECIDYPACAVSIERV